MLKLLKVTLVTVGTILLALFTLPFFIDVNDYKDDISQAVQDATGRQLHIEHIELSVFPWVGVRLNEVQLQNAEGFTEKNMLRVKTIDVQVALIPLFSQRIEVKRFELDTPQIWLAKHADGQTNWSDLVSKSATKKPDYPPTASPNTHTANTPQIEDHESIMNQIGFNAELLSLKNGLVTWSDDVYGKVSLSAMQLTLHDLQLLEPVAIDFSAQLAGSLFEVHADIGPIGDLAKLDVKTLPVMLRLQSKDLKLQPFRPWLPKLDAAQQVQIGALEDIAIGMDVSLEQHTDGQLLSSGQVAVRAKHTVLLAWKVQSNALKSIHVQEFRLGVDKTHVLAISGEIKGLPRKPRFEMRLETAKLQRIWLNRYIPALQKLYSGHTKPWKSVKLSALLAGDEALLDIRNLQLLLNDEAVQVSGNVALGQVPDVQLRITANELHADPWLPKAAEEKAVQVAVVEDSYAQNPASIEPDLRFLKPWYVSLQMHIKALHILKLELNALRLTLSAEKGIVRLNPVRFDIGDGQITENFTLNARNYPVTWQESSRMSGVQVLPILQAVADLDVLSGIAQLSTDMTGKGFLPEHMMKTLKGNGQFVFEDGQVKGLNLAKEIRKLQNKSAVGTQNNTDFSQMQGSFRIKKGIVTNKDLYMASPLFRLSGKGKLYLTPLKIDYHVRPKLIDSLAGQGGNNPKGLVIPLHISGQFDDLNISVEMDRASLLESAAALNKLSGNKVGGVAGKVLNQGFVKTRNEEVKKAKAKLQRKLAAEKERLKKEAEAELKHQAAEKLKNALKGFWP